MPPEFLFTRFVSELLIVAYTHDADLFKHFEISGEDLTLESLYLGSDHSVITYRASYDPEKHIRSSEINTRKLLEWAKSKGLVLEEIKWHTSTT